MHNCSHGFPRYLLYNYNCSLFSFINQFLTFTLKIFHEVNLYPTCARILVDMSVCFEVPKYSKEICSCLSHLHHTASMNFNSTVRPEARANIDLLTTFHLKAG